MTVDSKVEKVGWAAERREAEPSTKEDVKDRSHCEISSVPAAQNSDKNATTAASEERHGSGLGQGVARPVALSFQKLEIVYHWT